MKSQILPLIIDKNKSIDQYQSIKPNVTTIGINPIKIPVNVIIAPIVFVCGYDLVNIFFLYILKCGFAPNIFAER